MSCSVGAVRRLCTCMCFYLLPVCRFVPYLPFRVKFSLFRFTHTSHMAAPLLVAGKGIDGPPAKQPQATDSQR